MVQRGEQLRLAPKTRKTIRIMWQVRRQELDRNVTAKIRVCCSVHFAHAAGADLRLHVIVQKRSANHDTTSSQIYEF
jgi:hypothetical protein